MKLLAVVLLAACAPEITLNAKLHHANVRVPYQTDPAHIQVFPGDLEQPYDVLGDIEIMQRQRGALGELPTRDLAIRTMRQEAARLGAHAVIWMSFGTMGMSEWSYHELQGHGRAIRFR